MAYRRSRRMPRRRGRMTMGRKRPLYVSRKQATVLKDVASNAGGGFTSVTPAGVTLSGTGASSPSNGHAWRWAFTTSGVLSATVICRTQGFISGETGVPGPGIVGFSVVKESVAAGYDANRPGALPGAEPITASARSGVKVLGFKTLHVPVTSTGAGTPGETHKVTTKAIRIKDGDNFVVRAYIIQDGGQTANRFAVAVMVYLTFKAEALVPSSSDSGAVSAMVSASNAGFTYTPGGIVLLSNPTN